MENTDSLKKQAFSGFVWKFAERFCAQGISLVVSIILARILIPEDYSVVGIVTIFFSFCNIFISGGLNAALIQKKNPDRDDYSTILCLNLFLSTILYFIMFFASISISKIYKIDLLIPVIRIMGLTFFINSFKSILSAHISNTLQFKKFFFATIIGTIISAIIGIWMASNNYGPWALVAQQMSNSLIDTIVLWIVTKFKFSFVFSINSFKQMYGFGSRILLTSLISIIYDEMNPLIIGIKFTTADLSFYTKGKSFPSLINSTISNTLSSVLFPVMSQIQDNKKMILSATRSYIRLASYVIFPLMIGFFSISETFVLTVLTDKWMKAVPYLQVFCITYMFDIVQIGNLQAIKAIGRSDILLYMEMIKKSTYFVIILMFVIFSDKPELLAVSSIICTIVALLVNTYPNRKLIGYKYSMQISDVMSSLSISIIMGIIVVMMNRIKITGMILLGIQIFSGIIIYITLSIITKNDAFLYFLGNIKKLIGGKNG